MKIHALCLIKNESDIIEQTLISAITWADFIYVFDNGSTDGSWEKIVALSKKYSQIVPYKQEDCVFKDSLRSELFNFYKSNTSEGDWWCRLDADEIYIDNPRLFLQQVNKQYQVVVSATFHYYFTVNDLNLYNQNPSLFSDDVPIEKKCKYYINNWSEVRFFKYTNNLVWHEETEWPSGLIGDPYPIRIRLKNYQYRSPQQIQKRIDARSKCISNNLFPCEWQSNWESMLFNIEKIPYNVHLSTKPQTWKDRIVQNVSKLYYDSLDKDNYVLRNDLMPPLDTMSLIWDYRLTPRNLFKRLLCKIRGLL